MSTKKQDYDRDYNKRYIANLRNITLDLLGGKCVHCGYAQYSALQIDHINGGGKKELSINNCRKKYYEKVRNSFNNNEGIYQLLCANCNWVKRTTHNELGMK